MNPIENKLRAPRIVTALPGPKASILIERDERYTSPSYTRAYPLAVSHGEGAEVEDVDGNRFLDFTAGIAVCATGHCHPRIVKAIHQQSSRLIHMSGTDFYYGPQVDLAEKLAQIAPGEGDKRVFFTNSGAEAVEAAFKLARFHTGRQHVIAFLGGFHGRTMGALSLTASKAVQREGFSPLVPQVTHVEYPNPYRSGSDMDGATCTQNVLEHIEMLFKTTLPPAEVAAFIVEPIQGEGGYIVPPPDFHRRLKELGDKHGILYVADEVQTGMGRSGKMFAIEHWGVEPDIVCVAKGIASGMPLGAIISKRDVMNWPSGSHASTFGGNPVACAAALETVALLEEGLTTSAARVGDHLLKRLKQLAARHGLIGDVRGKGLMIGMELVHKRSARAPAVRERDRVIQGCFQKGLLLLGSGVSTVRLCPPLIVDENHVDTAVTIIDQTLGEISSI